MLRTVSILPFLVALSACVTIDSFRADPETVCSPNDTELSWAVSVEWDDFRDVTIDVAESDAPDDAFPSLSHRTPDANGTFPVSVPEGETRFSLYARGNRATDRDTVLVTGIGSEVEAGVFTFEPICRADASADGWQSIELVGYDPAISPRGITNTSDRDITVSHQGIDRTLVPGETSSAWNTTSLGGGWSVAADLLISEPRGLEFVTESCDPDRLPDGSVRPVPGERSRTIPIGNLTLAYAYAC